PGNPRSLRLTSTAAWARPYRARPPQARPPWGPSGEACLPWVPSRGAPPTAPLGLGASLRRLAGRRTHWRAAERPSRGVTNVRARGPDITPRAGVDGA